ASGASDFGKVMGVVMRETKGIADGNVVSRIVKEELK
ncbi:MAG: GatB/YqeY domain-containing protein, partial [Candidatus Pacebacteria bacterium]|nr:GatB/YqeY domain-containing protein [Candidatus Paceibacterota bacterium]